MHAYPIEIHTENTGAWATCPLVPEFHAAGNNVADLLNQAEDGLVSALSIYIDQRRAIPVPAAAPAGTCIHLHALTAAKVDLWNAMVAQGLNKADSIDLFNKDPV